MSILEMLHDVLADKLVRSHEDFIDIRFSRAQADELYVDIHRIITWNKNMKRGKADDQTGKD